MSTMQLIENVLYCDDNKKTDGPSYFHNMEHLIVTKAITIDDMLIYILNNQQTNKVNYIFEPAQSYLIKYAGKSEADNQKLIKLYEKNKITYLDILMYLYYTC